MGGSESKTTTEVVNETVQSVLFETVQSCKGPLSQEQVISVKNCKNCLISGVSMKQMASIDVKCFQKSSKSADFQNKLQLALSQMAESQTSGFAVSKSESENINRTVNKITQTVQDKVAQECVVSVAQRQAIMIDGSQNVVINDVTFNQTANAILECVQSSETLSRSVNDLSLQIDQIAKSKTTGLFDFSGLTWIIVGIIVLIGAIIAVLKLL